MGYYATTETVAGGGVYRRAPTRTRKTPYPRFSRGLFGRRFYSPELGRWLSREPLNELASLILYAKHTSLRERHRLGIAARMMGDYRVVGNNLLSTVDRDGAVAPAILLGGGSVAAAIGAGIYGAFLTWEMFFAPYSESEGAGSAKAINIRRDCTIVVLEGHGFLRDEYEDEVADYEVGDVVDAKKVQPHVFFFTKTCQAAGFVGCVAKETNRIIPEDRRIDGLNLERNLVIGVPDMITGGVDWNEDWFFSYHMLRAQEGARKKAKDLCLKDACKGCCKIDIFYEAVGWFPSGFDDDKCDCEKVRASGECE